MAGMEESLAREMAKLKITDERSMREAEMVFAASDELNELKARIQHAKLNKERSAQIAEAQYREQIEIEHDAKIDMHYLRRKEIED